MAFDLEECIDSIRWGILEVSEIEYKEDDWNAYPFLLKEHLIGMCSLGATAYKCKVGFNIDWDLRCECCGEIIEMGTADIDGPFHGKITSSHSPIALARSVSELFEHLGADRINPRKPIEQVGEEIHSIISKSDGCDCLLN